MAWKDLTEQEKAEVRADALAMVFAICTVLGFIAVWRFFN